MLADWLRSTRRNPAHNRYFDVIDTIEHTPPTDEVREGVRELIREDLFGLDLISRLAAALDRQEVGDWIRSSTPKALRMKRGDFGEVLAAALMHEFEGFEFPIKKLRYRVRPDDTLTGGDLLGLRVAPDGSIDSTVLAESKFSSIRRPRLAIDAYEQLKGQSVAMVPDIYKFVASRLLAEHHPLAGAFFDYLARRLAAASPGDSYRISLSWELNEWSDDVVDQLAAAEPDLDRLSLDAIRIEDLVGLVETCMTGLADRVEVDVDES